ncbi:ABC transporter C family protein (macronuclear) [Tetrahymena thermophila SB210]|uniref:ABC transporter C family protein n=1 Tax=Tetrahymena thermophila (strain SB210) TaxID=312017 RepID=Q22DK3_TETTS|nr:ABC transporter C family protein [Tetrahymena thermophila SB210]EAR83355.2 ABC transporter C family protein [Tetrahymena thermophila SB210]|eukprot:XP_001031018.2 ABC transporter C family protein [Tetrahymena thermophila SB210]
MSSSKKVDVKLKSQLQNESNIDQHQLEQESQNQIIFLQPTKKERDIYCKEVLPNSEIKAREHNILFSALTKLFKRANDFQKEEKQIQNEDIKDFITKSTQVRFIIEKLEAYKKRHPKDFSDPNNFNLRSIYILMTSKIFFICLFYSVMQSLLSCGCIFILDIITDKLKNYNGSSDQKRDLCLLLAAISLAYVLKNIFNTRQSWYQVQWKANTYATLQYLVFTKALRTQVISASSSIDGKKDKDSGKSNEYEENPDANNIMTVDIDQQQQIIWAITESFVDMITIGIVLLLIYYRIGNSIYNGLYILLAAFVFNIIVVYFMQFFFRRQYKKKDARVSISKDVIEGMKSIKYLGWEEIFKQKIEKIRSKEFSYIITTRCLDGVLSIFWNCISYFLLFFFLVSYVNDGNNLADSNVFTIIALFGILTGPIGSLPWSIGYLVKSRVSYRRIQKFLNEKEINHNNVVNLDLELNKNSSSNANQESFFESFANSQVQTSVNQIAISMRRMKFIWPVKKRPQNLKKKEDPKINQNKSKNSEENIQEPLLDNQYENSQEVSEKNMFELKIFDFIVNKGDLAIIIGKIGSGKSALLQAILNELDSQPIDNQESLIASNIEGSAIQEKLTNFEKKIIVNGRTGYVSQNHWLQNKTIKENILFGKQYDPVWYNECVESCDLKVDFNTFSKKDEKIVGPGGGNLSGGQRQRIAICRALYQNCDIYLFDDIFSSLDAHVADKVYQSVIVDALIKKFKKTVLLVTSHFSIFSNRSCINRIFYLQKGSLVYEQDKIEEFINSGISKEQEEEEEKKKKQQLELQLNSDEQIEDQQQAGGNDQQNNDLNKSKEEDDLNLKKKQSSKHQDKKAEEEDDDEEAKKLEEEKREKGNIKLDTFLTYFKSMGVFFLILLIITNFLMEGTQMIMDFWLRDYVSPSSAFFEDINSLFNSFSNTFLFFIALNLATTTTRAAFYCTCALLSGKRLFNNLNKSLIYSKMTFFDKNPVGRIVNRLSDDILCIDDYLPWTCHVFLEQMAYTSGYPIGVMIQFPWLVVFVLISIGLIYWVQRIFRLSNREIKRLNSVNSGKLLTSLGEACKGLILIRSFDRERFILKEYMERLNDSVNTYLIASAIQIWMSIRLLLISNFLFICVSVTSMVMIIGNFDFNYYTISMALTYSMLLSTRFSDLIRYFCAIEQNMVSVERIRQYFNNEQENPNFIEMEEDKKAIDEEQCNQDNNDIAIEFKNVYITYDEVNPEKNLTTESKDVQFALKDICLKIKKGEKIAFCGRTGSGKTSILNTLFNMYPIQFGSINVDGKNIKQYSLKQLRSKMSIIPQFGFLYNATLKDNLDPESQIPREIIQKKINETNLRIRDNSHGVNNDDNISDRQQYNNADQNVIQINSKEQNINNQTDDNLDFEIEDGGQNLSNGEKQVVNFLRIILRETDIVCLDEATSNMDPKTDAELHRQIFKFAENRTLLVITHRLENIELFDRVVVLEKGRIVECGNVTELRNIQGGFFNRLLKNH